MPTPIDFASLERIAIACRGALGLFVQSHPTMELPHFPSGACGASADIVGAIIKERLGYDITRICGWEHQDLRPEQSHAWIEVSATAIDITHDQFSDNGLSGWVFGERTTWHKRFARLDIDEGISPFSQWPPDLRKAYHAAEVAVFEAERGYKNNGRA